MSTAVAPTARETRRMERLAQVVRVALSEPVEPHAEPLTAIISVIREMQLPSALKASLADRIGELFYCSGLLSYKTAGSIVLGVDRVSPVQRAELKEIAQIMEVSTS